MTELSPKAIMNGVSQSVQQIEKAIAASLRPLPTETGDGTYVTSATKSRLVEDISRLDLGDIKTIVNVAKNAATGEPVDDKRYITEKLIQVSSTLIQDSPLRAKTKV